MQKLIKKKKLTAILTLINLFGAIATFAQSNTTIEISNSIEKDLNFPFKFISGLKFTGEEFLLTDAKLFNILKIDTLGAVLAKNGRRGKGPAEFSNGPSQIDYNKSLNEIAVLDQSANIVKFFDIDLNYKTDLITKIPVFDLDYDVDGNLLTSTLPKNDLLDSIIIYNPSKNTTQKFSPKIDPINILYDAFLIRSINNKLLCLIFINRNLIQIYDYQGNLKNEFMIDEIPEISEPIITNNGRNVGINKIPKGRLIVDGIVYDKKIFLLTGRYTFPSYQKVFIYDIEGYLKGSLILDKKARFINVVDSSFLFVNKEQDKVYELIDKK